MRRFLLACSLCIALLAGFAGWLLGSQSGLQHSLGWLQAWSGGKLQTGPASGRWLGPLQIEEIVWRDGENRFAAQQLQLDWQAGALWRRELRIDALVVAQLDIRTAPGDGSPPALPEQLTLPVALTLPAAHVGQLTIDALPPVSNLTLGLHSDGTRHTLENLAFDVAAVRFSGRGMLNGVAPFPLQASAQVGGRIEARPLALAITADGPLAALALELVPQSGMSGKAELTLTPFAPLPFSAAQLDLQAINLADWVENSAEKLPQAELALKAAFRPVGEASLNGVAGEFSLTNSQPGPADRNKLPLERLSGRLDWRDGMLNFPALDLQLPGRGEISGQGRWQGNAGDGHLALDLAVRDVNAQALLASLQKTRLSGRVTAALDARQQQVAADLRDQRFTLAATLSHADAVLDVARLVLQANGAGLTASGRLALTGARDFRLTAELDEFNPRAFADLPAARINASAKAQGQLSERPVVDAEFRLRDSHFRQAALAGAGHLRLAWPRISAADLWLALGSNRLEARGAFGRRDDQLQLTLAAPRLADLGGEGEAHGQFLLAGSLEALRLKGGLQSPRLGWPGLFQAGKLQLKADVSEGGNDSSDNAPLDIDFSLARLDLPAQAGAAENLTIRIEGSRRRHTLDFATQLPGGDQVRARASGVLASQPELVWQGELQQLQLASRNSARNARLQAPASLYLSRRAWRLADLHLAGQPLDWQARLGAQVRDARLNLNFQASGTRLGKMDVQLTAGMDGAWAFASEQPWQGELQLAAEDLGWLGEFLGEGKTTGGSLRGQLHLGGTPGAPQLRGQLAGQKLSFALAENGMQLQEGELRASIRDDLLRIETLSFSSPHRPLPRTLKRSLGDAAARHEKPGQLTATGQLLLNPQAASGEARVDVKLDRVGVWQMPEQWASLSGQAQLSWQKDHLGGQGALTIDAAYWQLAPSGAPSLSDDVVVRQPEQSAPRNLRPNLGLDLSLDFGPHFLFEGAGLSSHLAGQIRLTAQGRDLPRAAGRIRTRGGRFAAYGQVLEIERGILNFQGLPDNPALDVRAMRRGLAVEAGVEVSGTAQKPRIRLVSEPELPDAEKLTWLILGHGPENVGSGDASVLVAAAGDLLGNAAGSLLGQLKDSFGIDELGVHQGRLGGGGRAAGSRIVSGGGGGENGGVDQQILSVGKRLSSRATLTYEQSLGTAESIAKLSFALTRQLTLVGRVGSDNAIDLFYGMAWGRPPQEGKKTADAPAGTPAP